MFLFHQGLGSGHGQYQPFRRRTRGPSCPIFSFYRNSSLGSEREKATFPQPQGLDSSRTEQIWDLTPKKGGTRLLWGLGGPDEGDSGSCLVLIVRAVQIRKCPSAEGASMCMCLFKQRTRLRNCF